MEERPALTNAIVDDSAPPSVARLAGRFREQAAAAKETPASKPTRRRPPCSLSLLPPKVELGQNGEEKSLPSANHPPKVKVKSSPLIEKLQANLAFDPAALLPGASPKSPGLKAMVSPFHSPPSTPSSPGVRSRPSEPEEVPVSFDQPPEGSHLPCYNKVRTRGSIKRRPPSRRFRRSQSDCGELGEFGALEPSQENGAKEESGDEVFPAKSKAPGSPALRRTSSRTEKLEEKSRAAGEAQEPEKIVGGSEEGAGPHPARASSSEAEDGCGSPTEQSPAGEQAEEPAGMTETVASEEEQPGQGSQDTQGLEEAAAEEQPPQPPPAGGAGGPRPAQGASPQPGRSPYSGHAQPDARLEVPGTEDKTPVQDTKL
uniref:RCSD domain containing 1 n=1 Tax=Moschus moschiferus TaxID=68415 RepID=A0A8C6FP09_MOSMO